VANNSQLGPCSDSSPCCRVPPSPRRPGLKVEKRKGPPVSRGAGNGDTLFHRDEDATRPRNAFSQAGFRRSEFRLLAGDVEFYRADLHDVGLAFDREDCSRHELTEGELVGVPVELRGHGDRADL
jgi:hypothetical protein